MLSSASNESHGSELEYFEIAHSETVQPLMDSLKIKPGVQRELARGVTTKDWDWPEVEICIKRNSAEFAGAHAQVAAKIRTLMGKGPLLNGPEEMAIW